MLSAGALKVAAACALGKPEGEYESLSLRSLRDVLRTADPHNAAAHSVIAEIDRLEVTGAVLVGAPIGDAGLDALAEITARVEAEPSEEKRLEIVAGQHARLIEETSAIPQSDRLKLHAAGYVPIVQWRKANVTCATGSALKNIEAEERRAACGASARGHERGAGSEVDYCRHCGMSMPSMWTGR